ncbi:hypothetical protein ACL7TT_13390 [Microbulbifer sp. 2304DJ12-6]|uniref:hypothetical protein n=1 Tax=Microbulbifer sp. 2304DJ12-6 TaxID=3233340 RepID=UPI0039AEC3BA
MPNIHISSSKYMAPSKLQGWQWLPYIDKIMLDVVKRAITIIDKRIKGSKPCEAAFKTLPDGKSFTDIWNLKNVWISYDPDRSGNKYGVALNKQHISITAYALAMGQWMTAATIIHELAHVNGAPGNNTQAEDMLLKCMLKQHHNPNIIGQIRNSKLKNVALV